MNTKKQVYGPRVMFTLLFVSLLSLLPLSVRAAGTEKITAAAENRTDAEREAAGMETAETEKAEAEETGHTVSGNGNAVREEYTQEEPAEGQALSAQEAAAGPEGVRKENMPELQEEDVPDFPAFPELTEEEMEAFSEEEAETFRQLKAAYELMEEQWWFVQDQISLTRAQLEVLSPVQTTAVAQTAPGLLLIQLSTALSEQETQAVQLVSQMTELLESIRKRQEERKKGPEIIFVGDSRFAQMQDAVGKNSYVWIAKVSQGYQWFSEEAISQIDEEVGYGTKILLNLGVNDTVHVNSYIRLVNRKAREWAEQGAEVYYASVNPVENGRYVTVKMVRDFNTKLKAGLDPEIHWIDSYSFLQKTGYRLTDGLHYGNDTYRRLYQYYLSVLDVEDKEKKG